MEALSIMSKDRVEDYGGSATMTTSLGTQTSMRSSRFEEQLLLGIPDEITLDLITSKLPWSAIHNLRLVSHRWQQAIRQVYDARARLKSSETLVVVKHEDVQQNLIALYSMWDKRFYCLPPIPHVDGGIPTFSQCVSLDGKIYVLGGLNYLNHQVGDPGCEKVYVLDLGEQRHWKQCASMQEPRFKLGCGVIHGKIYVCGGFSLGKPVRVSEVYDPKLNAWYPIMPMISYGRWGHHVETVEEELYVYGGQFQDWDLTDGTRGQNIDFDRFTNPLFLENYHPIRNEWRKVDKFKRCRDEKLFVAQGKLYSMSGHNVSVYALRPAHSIAIYLHDVLAVDNELLALVYCSSGDIRTNGRRLLQSRGFGLGNERILWDKVSLAQIEKDQVPPGEYAESWEFMKKIVAAFSAGLYTISEAITAERVYEIIRPRELTKHARPHILCFATVARFGGITPLAMSGLLSF